MLLILEILYIKLLICIFLLETMLLFFSNEFSVIYMYLLKNLNNFELMDKQEAIILLLTVYLTLSLSRELELLEKIIPFCYIPKTDSTMRKRSQEGLF